MKSDVTWIAFLLKDKYATNFEKARLKGSLCNEFGFSEEDVCYVPFERNVGLSYYFFIKERTPDDMRSIFNSRRDAFAPFESHARISDAGLNDMMRSARQCERGYVKYGDIVTIKRGVYSKLHGIVLRMDRKDRVLVGLKFCFGTVISPCDEADLEVDGNIFNYIKVLN